jgi:hypothetical protein
MLGDCGAKVNSPERLASGLCSHISIAGQRDILELLHRWV